MSVYSMITQWEYLPVLIALIAVLAAVMAFWRFTENDSTAARRRHRRQGRKAMRARIISTGLRHGAAIASRAVWPRRGSEKPSKTSQQDGARPGA